MASLSLRRFASFWISCTTTIKPPPPPPPQPWLMLPPKLKGGDMLYNFYSLADDRVFTFNKKRGGGGAVDSDQIPPDDAKLVGSSHGWLASFDERSNHVFLSNPISGRHVKLPAVDTLPDPHINLFEGRGSVSRVILSASPEEEGSHAMLTFGPGRRLAFCAAAGGGAWTPLGGGGLSWYEDEEKHVLFAKRPWEDLVYCTASREFITIQPLTFAFHSWGEFVRDREGKNEKHCEMFHWKVPKGHDNDNDNDNDSYSYRGSYHDNGNDGQTFVCLVDDCDKNGAKGVELIGMLEKHCIQMPHLVFVEEISGRPLIVLRFLRRGIGENDDPKLARPEIYRARINTFPYRSVGFLVLKAGSSKKGIEWRVVKDLKGLALFVGMNHSFAVPATGKLKANSIYFTDTGRITPPDPDHAPQIYGGHDIGIYDYENKTISSCYYPCDFESFERIDPAPMWFTPNFN